MFFSNGTTRNERHPAKLLALIAVLALAMLVSIGNMHGAAAAAPQASGDLDPTFGTGGKVSTEFGSTLDQVNAMVIQPDGKILAAGAAWPGSPGRAHFALARYNANGMLDAGFGTGGTALI